MIVDSNIIIYSARPEYIALTRYLQTNEDYVNASLISSLEVLGFYNLSERDKFYFEDYFRSITVFPITSLVIDKAIELRQQRKRSLADSIIAATALLHSMPVLTNNVADFADIDGLQVIRLADVLNA